MKPQRKANAIALLSTIGFFGIFSTTISKSPVLPLFLKSMHSSDSVIGIIGSISPLAGILFSFPVGMLADRLGKKRLLLAAALVFVSAPLLYLLVANPWWLIPIRFFHGIATAILGPVASAVILSEYREDKGEKLGIYSSATLAGRTLAPLVGGLVISLFAGLTGGWNYRLVYACAFLLSLPVLVLTLRLPEGSGSGTQVKKVSLRDFGSSLAAFAGNGRLLGTALVEAATYFASGALELYLPILMQAKGMPTYQISLILSLQVLAIGLSKPFFGKLSDRIDRRVQILIGTLVLGISFALVPLAPGPVAAGILVVVFGLALSLSTVATSTYVSDVASAENLGSSVGALSSIMDIGQSAGPIVVGFVAQASTATMGFFTGFGICAAASMVFALFAYGSRRMPGSNP
jgi:MFS family permease